MGSAVGKIHKCFFSKEREERVREKSSREEGGKARRTKEEKMRYKRGELAAS